MEKAFPTPAGAGLSSGLAFQRYMRKAGAAPPHGRAAAIADAPIPSPRFKRPMRAWG